MIDDFLDFNKYSPVNLSTFFIVCVLSALLSYICIRVYLLTLNQTISKKDEHELVLTVIVMGVVASLVSLIVGANVARAFAIFGVMSIVRFRASIGKEYSVVFIFMSVALGMCCGAGYYTLAILYCLFAVLVIFIINSFFGKKSGHDKQGAAKNKRAQKADAVEAVND